MEYDVVRFIKYDLNIEVIISLFEETIWLSREDMATLFSRDRSVIGKHIKNLLKDEYAKNSVWAKIARTGSDGKEYDVDYFNLDIVLAVGNKIKSKNGLLLEEFLKKYLNNYYKKENQSIIMYNNGNISLPVTVSPYEETVWLNKEQLVLLFDTTRQNVEYHIENIYSQGELEEGATCKDFLQV